jgi:DMSO/TMAO reductase YedYZ molybdopterin-dependent catalytic subunit
MPLVFENNASLHHPSGRRRFLGQAGAFGAILAASPIWPEPAWADKTVYLPLPGGPGKRELTTAFPQKGEMILQRTRPPLLETPFAVFDKGIFTPNDQFYVRWHWAGIPSQVDVSSFRLAVHGNVNQPLSLSLTDLLTLPRVEMAAVNQCSGNSRGFFQPRVPGAQWDNGAMGNALWTGFRLRDLLDRAGVKPGSVAVRFKGLETPVLPNENHFMKSLSVDHARDGEVMVAYQMNHEQMPLINGFPIRLIVPGWFSTYWMKMLCDIEVLDQPDKNFWTTVAYRIPDTQGGNVTPDQTGYNLVPISRMPPRSFITNLQTGDHVSGGAPVSVRGIAFGGDAGVARVDLSTDGGATWRATMLGPDAGKYGFRRWQAQITAPASGTLTLKIRCANTKGETQLATPIWNPGGFMRNSIETTTLTVT